MTVDARGLSCPEPVILVMQALKSKENSYEVLVDNRTAFENVSRNAAHAGYSVDLKMEGPDYHMTLHK